MKKRLCILLSAALLAGCAARVPDATVPPTETGWETPASQPTAQRVDQLDVPPLPVLAPEQRFRFTAFGSIVETENGYYAAPSLTNTLFYADKSNTTNWVVVCNRPDCSHKRDDPKLKGNPCPAWVGSAIWEQDGNLYALLDQNIENPIFAQVGWDGSGLTPAYSDPNVPLFSPNGVWYHTLAYSSGVCFNASEMQTDGAWDSYLYFIDQDGSHKLPYAAEFPDGFACYSGNESNQARGDLTMLLPQTYEEATTTNPLQNPELLYRVTPDSAEPLNLPEGCPYFGAYLSGDTMVHYHPNEGFYRLDIPSGKEVKVQDAAYKDGFGYCLDGTFLVETNVCHEGTHTDNAAMRYFDGKSWTEVTLPPDFTPDRNLNICGLTSEHLFFTEFNDGFRLYAVKLGDTELFECLNYHPWQ